MLMVSLKVICFREVRNQNKCLVTHKIAEIASKIEMSMNFCLSYLSYHRTSTYNTQKIITSKLSKALFVYHFCSLHLF